MSWSKIVILAIIGALIGGCHVFANWFPEKNGSQNQCPIHAFPSDWNQETDWGDSDHGSWKVEDL